MARANAAAARSATSATRATRALVVADGDVPTREELDAAWPDWDDAALVVAADAGWAKALALGLRPELLVGDADSLSDAAFEAIARDGVEIERSPAMKDESDTELALLAALRRGARHVTIVGALGGRLDHGLANIGLLALPDPGGPTVALLDELTRVRLLRAPVDGEPACLELHGATGEIVSLLPFGAVAEGVTTSGLLYPLRDEPLPTGPARGLSNLRTAATASVTLRRGQLLVIETKRERPADAAAGRGDERSEQ